MDWQTLVNAALGGVCTILGWVLRALWTAIADLRADLTKLEVQLAREYVPLEEFRSVSSRIFEKLDAIAERLNNKADRRQ